MLCDICIVIFEVFNINVRVWNVSKKEFEFERKNVLKHILWSTVSSSHLVSKFMIRRLLLNGTYQTLKMFITCRVWFELQSFYNLQCRKLQLPKKWQMSCTYRKLSRILNPQQNSRKPPESPTRTQLHTSGVMDLCHPGSSMSTLDPYKILSGTELRNSRLMYEFFPFKFWSP